MTISKPLGRCLPCFENGTEVVDWVEVRSIVAFTIWECNQCKQQTVLHTYILRPCDEPKRHEPHAFDVPGDDTRYWCIQEAA